MEFDFNAGLQDGGNTRDPKLPLPGTYFSPIGVIGFSQKWFAKFAGISMNETVEASLHSIGLHIYAGLPMGWQLSRHHHP